jgi:hypothetical protein
MTKAEFHGRFGGCLEGVGKIFAHIVARGFGVGRVWSQDLARAVALAPAWRLRCRALVPALALGDGHGSGLAVGGGLVLVGVSAWWLRWRGTVAATWGQAWWLLRPRPVHAPDA